jgi:hypothetical protein
MSPSRKLGNENALLSGYLQMVGRSEKDPSDSSREVPSRKDSPIASGSSGSIQHERYSQPYAVFGRTVKLTH